MAKRPAKQQAAQQPSTSSEEEEGFSDELDIDDDELGNGSTEAATEAGASGGEPRRQPHRPLLHTLGCRLYRQLNRVSRSTSCGSLEPCPSLVADDDEEVEGADSDDEELREALVDYMATANQERTMENQNTHAGEPGTSDSHDDR